MTAFVLLAALGSAQETPVAVPLYRPTIDGEHTFVTDTAGLTDDRGLTARLAFGLGPARFIDGLVDEALPFGSRSSDDDPLLTRTDILLGYQFEALRVGLDVPVYAMESGGFGGLTGGVGDIAVDTRVTLRDRRVRPFGLAVQGRLFVPTSDRTDEGLVVGNEYAGWELSGIVEGRVGDKVLVAANAGLVEVDLDPDDAFVDDLFVRGSARLPVGEVQGVAFGAVSDVEVRWRVDDPPPGVTDLPILGLVGGWLGLTDDLTLRVGVGGELALDTWGRDVDNDLLPRAVVDLTWSGRNRVDADRDGIPNGRDRCALEAEDFDGVDDDDGCPDLDDDGDGLVDELDLCPALPETHDGVDDLDGCPDDAGVTVRRRPDERVVGPLGFHADALTPDARATLDALAARLGPDVRRVRIRGPGSPARARAVEAHLAARGVDTDALDVVFDGERR